RAMTRVARDVDDLAAGADDVALCGSYDRLDLERAIAALADGFRLVFVLHDVQGYTHEEIADLLGIEPGTSKSQLSRARRALRRALYPPGGAACPSTTTTPSTSSSGSPWPRHSSSDASRSRWWTRGCYEA